MASMLYGGVSTTLSQLLVTSWNLTHGLTVLLHLGSLEATCATVSLIIPPSSLLSQRQAYILLHFDTNRLVHTHTHNHDYTHIYYCATYYEYMCLPGKLLSSTFFVDQKSILTMGSVFNFDIDSTTCDWHREAMFRNR